MGSFEEFLQRSGFGIPESMINRGLISLVDQEKKFIDFVSQRKLPEEGWNSKEITHFLSLLSKMDSSNDARSIRIGEREARLSTELLEQTSFGFNHGVGRSGNISASQPKAVGASILQSLLNISVLNLIKELGLVNIRSACVLPLSTGMSLGLTLRSMDPEPFSNHPKKVIMPRIDHLSPKKGLELMRYQIVPVETKYGSSELASEGVYCDPNDVEAIIDDDCFAIVSTTTFFAPRVPDPIKEIAKIAQKHNIIHVINNAYGLQADSMIRLIRSAIDAGRVDAIVSSTDKNFLCPVGGSVVYGPSEALHDKVSKVYAGRASSAPYVQLLISLLSMGTSGYLKIRADQKTNKELLDTRIKSLAEKLGERVINSNNPVSVAMTLNKLKQEYIAELGGYLYNLRITGPRIVDPRENSYGCCSELLKTPYVVMNAAIGASSVEIEKAVEKLGKAIDELKRKE